eukprot:1145594-Pelagomonas_calceolata.AAC.1
MKPSSRQSHCCHNCCYHSHCCRCQIGGWAVSHRRCAPLGAGGGPGGGAEGGSEFMRDLELGMGGGCSWHSTQGCKQQNLEAAVSSRSSVTRNQFQTKESESLSESWIQISSADKVAWTPPLPLPRSGWHIIRDIQRLQEQKAYIQTDRQLVIGIPGGSRQSAPPCYRV